MSNFEEWANATSEVAKLGRASIEATEKLGGFLQVFGTPVEDAVGLLIGDKLVYLRFEKNWKRYLRMIDQVNKDLLERNCQTVRPIPPKLEIPLIINASLEEDDDLQDIWCKLIANALDSNFNLEIRFAYIDIIKNLTSLDAKVLKFVYNEILRMNCIPQNEPVKIYMAKVIVDLKNIKKYLNVSEEELTISYNNLIRVQCLKLVSSLNPLFVKEGERMPLMVSDPMHVIITPLGIAFIEACMK